MRVRFSISEDEYLKFAKEKANAGHKILQNQIPVQLVLSDGSVYPETGSISLSNRQIDPATGSLMIQAVFPNAKSLLRPGQYAKIRLQTDIYKDAVIVPQQTVNQIQNIYQVFVVNDSNFIRPTVIKVGKRVGSNWIVESGLKQGEKVAIIGSAVINPKVEIKPVVIPWNYDSTSNQ
jgi:membrane fusion protein (multidrug efflux system)